MDWLNIHRSTLGDERFLGCDPVQRATWLCLMAYCADQENGGRIDGAASWADRKWQQVVRVTKVEAEDVCPLWVWDGDSLIVWAYPIEKEEEVKRNRINGRTGGRPTKPKNNQVVTSGLTNTETHEEPPAPISAETERNRKGIGREEEEPARGIPPADHSDLIPGKLRSMEFANAWQSWMAYQEEKGFPVQRTQAKFALLALADNPGDGHTAAAWIADSIKQGRRAIEKPREAPRSSDQGSVQVPAWKAERNAKLDGQIRRLIGQKAQNAHRPQTCKEIDREIEDLERQKSQ